MKRVLLAALLLLGPFAPAHAADYPVKPIRIVVPYGPGGATDIVARILGEHLKEKFRQPVVVENKPGGNGIVALQETVRAKPDGYTFLIGNITTNLLMPLIGDPPLAFDPFKELVPIARLNDVPGVFLASKVSFPPNTLQEVVEYARARPGEVNHLTAGILAYSHIDFLMLQKRTGIKLTAIPLRAGAGGGQIDLINGAVQIALQNAATVTPLVKAGKLKALAVTSAQRSAAVPDLPTIAEAGPVPGYEASSWFGLLAPAGTPRDIVERVQQESAKALATPVLKERLLSQGAIPSGMTPDKFAAFIAAETKKWAKVVKASGAKVD